MIVSIAWFEVRKALRRFSTYVYFSIFFAISCLTIMAAGGAFPNAGIGIVGSGGKTMVNAPFTLCILISVISYFGLLITSGAARLPTLSTAK